MSLNEIANSIHYLTERYIDPHVERVSVNNKKLSFAEARSLVEKFKALGMITVAPPVKEDDYRYTDEQIEEIARRRAAGGPITVIAYMMKINRKKLGQYIKENKS